MKKDCPAVYTRIVLVVAFLSELNVLLGLLPVHHVICAFLCVCRADVMIFALNSIAALSCRRVDLPRFVNAGAAAILVDVRAVAVRMSFQ